MRSTLIFGLLFLSTLIGCSSSSPPAENESEDDGVKLPRLKPAGLVAPTYRTEKGAEAAIAPVDPYFDLGIYLTSVAACGSCHGKDPKEPNSPLSGGRPLKDQFGPVNAANITPDKETGIGGWTVNEIVRAMRTSVGKSEHALSLELHSGYRWMSDRDARAIATYLLASPPVKNGVDRRELGIFERKRLGLFTRYSTVEGYIPSPRRSGTPAYGRYLAKSVTNCGFCHTEAGGLVESAVPFAGGEQRSGRGFFESIQKLGELLMKHEDSSQREADAAAVLAAADAESPRPAVRVLKPNEEFPVGGPDIRGTSGELIKDWTEEQIADYLSFGSSPDGKQVDGGLCPWPYYSIMEESDKLAIARFLKTL